MSIPNYLLGTNKNRSNYYDVFKKWLPKPKAEVPAEPEKTETIDIEAEEAVADAE